jgi:hypothetical protein
MDSQSKVLSDEIVVDTVNRSTKEGVGLPEEEVITNTAFLLWINSQTYKQPRMNQIQLFERLYNNNLPKKQRQLFNVCMPIFAGFEDALQANLTDPVQLKFTSRNPADYLVLPKIQAQWEEERDGLASHQMWNSKARDLMHDALISGRATAKIFGESDPEFRNVFDTTNYTNFHCQPLGGGDLENHLFAGEDSVYMTIEDIISNPNFPQKQRDKIKNFSYTDEWWQQLETSYGTVFSRFKSLGLQVESNTFTGTKTLMLNQFVVTKNGVRYYVLFDPVSKHWLQCEKLEDYLGVTDYPWKSAATHQDSQNFWSKGFSDDIFQVALTISTLLNQELTNREKQNFNARAYDPLMFTDEAKLDSAQYIPDRLVPVNTAGGTRQIAEGIYSFQTPELQGTINLVQWLESDLGKNVGITDLTQGAGQKGNVKAAVAVQQQQQVAKRIGFRAQSFQEMFGRIGQTYITNLKEFMPAKLPVKLLGENGFTEEADLKLVEVKGMGKIGVTVVSTSAEQSDNDAKKQAKMQSLTMVAQDPNVSSEWRTEQTLKFGGWDDSEVRQAMDTQTYGSRKMVAKASLAIQELLNGEMPDPYFNADTSYMQYIQDFAIDNKDKLTKKKAHPEHGTEVALIMLFTEYLQTVAPLVQANMARKAQAMNAGRMPSATATGQQNGQTEPGGAPNQNAQNQQAPAPQPAAAPMM